MLTPIRPSLSQALLRSGGGQAAPAANETSPEPSNPALAARQAFFRQINGETAQATPGTQPARSTQTPQPRQLPAQSPQASAATPRPAPQTVFKAADIAKAQAQGEAAPPLRPGSLLNIVV